MNTKLESCLFGPGSLLPGGGWQERQDLTSALLLTQARKYDGRGRVRGEWETAETVLLKPKHTPESTGALFTHTHTHSASPPTGDSHSAAPGRTQEHAFLTSVQVLLLIEEPHVENRWPTTLLLKVWSLDQEHRPHRPQPG